MDENKQSIDVNDLKSRLSDAELASIGDKYSEKIKKAYIKSIERGYQNKIKEINNMNRNSKKNNDSVTASKFFMMFIIVNCSIIEIYSMISMIHFGDLSALSSLIVAVVSESISYAVYCAKAYRSKKSEVESQLERDKFEFEKENALEEIENMDMNDSYDNIEIPLGGKRFIVKKRK